MKRIQFMLIMMSLLTTQFVYANADPALGKSIVFEYKTFDDFDKNFKEILESMIEEGSGLTRDGNDKDQYHFCVHNDQMIQLFEKNKQFKKEFDKKYESLFGQYEDTLKGYKKYKVDAKAFCEKAQAGYNKI